MKKSERARSTCRLKIAREGQVTIRAAAKESGWGKGTHRLKSIEGGKS